eukprot:gene18404-25934_t
MAPAPSTATTGSEHALRALRLAHGALPAVTRIRPLGSTGAPLGGSFPSPPAPQPSRSLSAHTARPNPSFKLTRHGRPPGPRAAQPDDLEKAPGHMQGVRSQVPIPDAVIGSAGRQRIAVFRTQQIEFGVLLLGDIDHQADHAVRATRFDHCAAQVTHPHDLARLGNQPVAHLVGMAVRGVVGGIVDHQGLLQIIGMHMRPPEARVSPPLLDGVAEQVFVLRAQKGIAHPDFSLPHHAINGFQQAQKALANFHQHLLGDLGDLDQDTLAADHPLCRIRLRVELQTHP